MAMPWTTSFALAAVTMLATPSRSLANATGVSSSNAAMVSASGRLLFSGDAPSETSERAGLMRREMSGHRADLPQSEGAEPASALQVQDHLWGQTLLRDSGAEAQQLVQTALGKTFHGDTDMSSTVARAGDDVVLLAQTTLSTLCSEEHQSLEVGTGDGSTWRCSDGRCIPQANHCNGWANCADNSDETTCGFSEDGPMNSLGKFSAAVACDQAVFPPDARFLDIDSADSKTYRCAQGACVPKKLRCNGVLNCYDGSDEVGCAQAMDTAASVKTVPLFAPGVEESVVRRNPALAAVLGSAKVTPKTVASAPTEAWAPEAPLEDEAPDVQPEAAEPAVPTSNPVVPDVPTSDIAPPRTDTSSAGAESMFKSCVCASTAEPPVTDIPTCAINHIDGCVTSPNYPHVIPNSLECTIEIDLALAGPISADDFEIAAGTVDDHLEYLAVPTEKGMIEYSCFIETDADDQKRQTCQGPSSVMPTGNLTFRSHLISRPPRRWKLCRT